MKRVYVLGVIVLAGALAAAAGELAAQGQGAPGQGRGGGRGGGGGGAQALTIAKVADNLYMVVGAGGNTAAYVAANGVVLVDTKNPNNGQAILDQVKTVTDKPVTHLNNTHTHADHTGSNAFFPATVEVVTHENTAANMKKMKNFAEPDTAHGLPDRTFSDKMTVLSGNDAIDLYYFGPSHTNGDAFVVFRNLRAMHSGDAFAQKGQPFIDTGNGGSGVQYGETLGKAAAGIKNVTTVITGHSPAVMTWQDLVDYGEFNRLMVQQARAAMKSGKTPEQAMADFTAAIPAKFKDYSLAPALGRGGSAGNFTAIMEELKTAR
jgi:glyoxylase-like metal-dependent hydrolase (beta-lactamase superfamily II)